MPYWVEVPEDWELYQSDMEEVSRFWDQGWMDRLDSDIANKVA